MDQLAKHWLDYIQPLASPDGGDNRLRRVLMATTEFTVDAPMSRRRLELLEGVEPRRVSISYLGVVYWVYVLAWGADVDDAGNSLQEWVSGGMPCNEGYNDSGFRQALFEFNSALRVWWSIYDDIAFALTPEPLVSFRDHGYSPNAFA